VTNQKIEQLLTLIREVIDEEGNWKAKRKTITEVAKQDSRWEIALEEFCSWFEDPQSAA